MSDSDILRGAKQIGDYIGETAQTTERMCRRGDLPAYKHSRGWRMRVSEYEQFLVSKRCGDRGSSRPNKADFGQRETVHIVA